MFYNCSSLEVLPDISKWDTSNVESMYGMFHNCISLITLPDLSKWNINNVDDMSYMFDGCLSLAYLPNISSWNCRSVTDIFNGTISLVSKPIIYSKSKIWTEKYQTEWEAMGNPIEYEEVDIYGFK